jgi:NAD(P)-dependent dehydrogenase (short-subunit alcohol dehydrogenase family)
MDKVRTTKSVVAVFGATGHTGRFVIAELMRRGVTPVAIARDAAALAEATFPEPDVLRRHATIDDAASLDRALHGAQAAINCAGPFIDTADAVASAALRARIHYLDVCAEQGSAEKTLEKFDEPARQAGVAVVPSMAFYGGLPDLMATAALGDWAAVDSIEIMIGLDSWHPTRGTRITVDRKAVGNLAITGGRLAPAPTPPAQKRWNFGDPLGDQAVIEVPFSEAILISRHMKTGELHNYLSQLAVDDVLDPATPTPKATDETGRSNQHFVVDVVVTRGDERRRATVRGRDIYAISAPLVCEAVERLLVGKFSATGAHAPGEIFDAGDILAALGPDNSTFEVFAA